MVDLGLYKENRNLKRKIDELQERIIQLESSPYDLLLGALNLFLKDTKQMDAFFEYIKTASFERCINNENILLKRWQEE